MVFFLQYGFKICKHFFYLYLNHTYHHHRHFWDDQIIPIIPPYQSEHLHLDHYLDKMHVPKLDQVHQNYTYLHDHHWKYIKNYLHFSIKHIFYVTKVTCIDFYSRFDYILRIVCHDMKKTIIFFSKKKRLLEHKN